MKLYIKQCFCELIVVLKMVRMFLLGAEDVDYILALDTNI